MSCFSPQLTARVWPSTLKSSGAMCQNLQRWTAATTKISLIPRWTGTGSVQGGPWPSSSTQLLVDSRTTGGALQTNIQPSKIKQRVGLWLWRTCSLKTLGYISVPSVNTVMWEAEQLNKNWLTINLMGVLNQGFIYPEDGASAPKYSWSWGRNAQICPWVRMYLVH